MAGLEKANGISGSGTLNVLVSAGPVDLPQGEPHSRPGSPSGLGNGEKLSFLQRAGRRIRRRWAGGRAAGPAPHSRFLPRFPDGSWMLLIRCVPQRLWQRCGARKLLHRQPDRRRPRPDVGRWRRGRQRRLLPPVRLLSALAARQVAGGERCRDGGPQTVPYIISPSLEAKGTRFLL